MAFVQANSTALGSGSVISVSLSLLNPVKAGSAVFAFISYQRDQSNVTFQVSDSQGNFYQPTGGNGFQSLGGSPLEMYMTGPTVAGTYTITFTCQPLFGSIQKVGVALVEYDDIPLYVNGNTSNPFPVSLLGYQNPDSITSLSGGVNPSVLNTGNAVWSPPANYSLTNPTYLHVVQDTEVTPAFQQASNSGVSGLVPPAWNPTLFGTTVGDG